MDAPLQPLPWLPVLETGHSDIDRQHHALIDDANAVQAIVLRRGAWSDLAAALDKMRTDCTEHFADENKLLARAGFAEATAHALEHERILREIEHIHDSIRGAPAPTPFHWELALTLRSLLIDHFLRYDLRYKSHLMYYAPLAP